MASRPDTNVFLETERLVLRRLNEADALLLHELDSDPEVMRYLSGGRPTPFEQIRHEILPRFIGYYDRAPWAGVWVALEKPGGEFLGWLSLRPDDDLARGGDLGYRLRRSAWRRGLATEGPRAPRPRLPRPRPAALTPRRTRTTSRRAACWRSSACATSAASGWGMKAAARLRSPRPSRSCGTATRWSTRSSGGSGWRDRRMAKRDGQSIR